MVDFHMKVHKTIHAPSFKEQHEYAEVSEVSLEIIVYSIRPQRFKRANVSISIVHL